MEKTNRRTFLRTVTTGGASLTAGLTIMTHSTRNVHAQAAKGQNRIVYRTLGSTGFKVSEIGMGCMNMRDSELVRAAIDSGINYIDTAHAYMNGQNEETVGQVMKTYRDKVFLTTKVGLRTSITEVPRQMELSLKRLQTDHVDLLLLHHGGDTVDMVLNEDNMKVMDAMRKKGYTRFVGYSTHTGDTEVYDNTIKTGFWEAVLCCYNYQSPPGLTPSIEKLRKSGIAVIAMKNLLNFATRPRTPLEDIRTDKSGSVTYKQALIKWVLSNQYVDVTIPGITAFEQLTENMAIMGTTMGYDDHRILKRYSEGMKRNCCLGLSGCTGCEGQCPRGVRVSELNRCLGYAYDYGDMRLAWENYRELPRSSRVDVCKDCSECQVKCVNGQNLTENISRAKELFG
ncbi:MAG TPA: aldo/keto reductase [Anaerolineae bacterium]|nr:aldo/keto reductase [Anaerolineae bacterium]